MCNPRGAVDGLPLVAPAFGRRLVGVDPVDHHRDHLVAAAGK
jgi:hypothetical protein